MSAAHSPHAARAQPRPVVMGVALAVAFFLLLLAGVLVLGRLAQQRAAAAVAGVEWMRTAHEAVRLVPGVSDLYAAGVEAAPEATDQALTERRQKLETNFRRQDEVVEKRMRRLAEPGEREDLLRQLAEVRRVVEEMKRHVAAGTGRDAAGGFRELYQEAIAACMKLDHMADQVEQHLFSAHERLSARFLMVEYALAGTLLALLLAGALYFHYHARREHALVVEKERLLAELEAGEVKYRSIFDHAVEGIFQTTPDGRFVTANPALARMYGFDSPAELVEKLTDITNQLYVEPGQREALLAALQKSDVLLNVEFEVLRTDGRAMWVRENVRAVRDAAGQLLYLEGTVEDVSGLWWGELRRRLQYLTARVLAEAASVDEARPQILRTICETLEWAMGAVWDVDDDGQHMQCVEIWQAATVDMTEFERANAEASLRRGEGLAGEAWELGEPRWIADLQAATEYANAAIALRCGMSSAFAVPVQVHGEVVHVLEFFSPKMSLPDPELLQTLGAIASQLGHLIERKRAEEALRRSETRKAAILQSALDCIVTFDPDGRILEFNPAAEQAFGYAAADALGREIAELILPEMPGDRTARGRALQEVLQTGAALDERREWLATHADGSEFPVELALRRIVIDERPIFTAFIRDITDRKEAEHITSELGAVVANSNDAIIGCTLEGVIQSWNIGAERIFGYSAAEAINTPFHLIIPPDRLDEFPQTLTAVRRGDSLANYETVRLRKDGKKISVSITDSPIRSEGGGISGLSSIARDITERKRLEEELLQSQKMDAVGRLAGGIAHDFNNILTAILGYSDLIIGQIDERQWMYKHLTEIRKAADFAAALTHQLLAFSRRQSLHLRVFNLNDTVRNMEKMLRRVIGEHIQITTDFRAVIGRLKADPSQLEQVLLNLCVNARDAMPGGGVITIETEDVTYFLEDFYEATEMPAGEYVKLSVTDTGHGMAAEVKKHIFEPFFTTKEKGQGTGLGLATCYGIVKQSGGYITVESTVNVGTTFSIFLRRVDETGEHQSIRKEVGKLPGGNETILYVEDEVSVRSLTSHVLRRLGYTVFEAADGKQARDVVESNDGHEVDLLFSDVVLPDAGGRELADWIKARNQQTKILFTSGYVDENILKRHGLDSESAFLQKPFTPSDLANRVREVMDSQAT